MFRLFDKCLSGIRDNRVLLDLINDNFMELILTYNEEYGDDLREIGNKENHNVIRSMDRDEKRECNIKKFVNRYTNENRNEKNEDWELI